MFWSKHQEVSV